MKTILLATDFSENAKHAAFFGYDLAKHLNAKVAIATAIAVPIVVPQTGMELWPMEQQIVVTEHSELDLKRLKNDLENGSYEHSYKPKVECLCKVGPLNDVISDINDQQKIDLVVMGTHKGGAFTRLLSGDHSREFINNGGIPMLLVPKGNSLKSIKKIAFATELKHLENDLESIYQIINIARPLHAEILLVHIQKGDEEVPENEKAFKEFTTELSNKSNYPLIYYKILKNKSVDEGLNWLCANGKVDMLAMVHGKHHLISKLLNKSHTIKMAEHIKLPLLIFPNQE
jgi:nucleotide-binding universal stress UspA family protein